ncbi:hypothetical protein K7432_010621 [Basidiobolus ranarum]|uniref:DMT family transporter n=1 Tax=Basidiobolus ranarum TaxID=34480 RepID=A0ABR2VVK8_9FUNG
MLDKLLVYPLVVAGGICLGLQAGVNATLGGHIGRSLSATISFTESFILMSIYFSVDTKFGTKFDFSNLKKVPWWGWIGGILGAFFVFLNILITPKLGAGTVLGIVVSAQAITSVIIDHFGLLGVPKRKATILRLCGCVGLVGSVAVITIF